MSDAFCGVIDVTQAGVADHRGLAETIQNVTTTTTADPRRAAELWNLHALSDAGVPVNASTALQISAVWQAITIISNDVAKLPLALMENSEDGEPSRRRGEPLEVLVRKRANPEIHAFKFWRRLIALKLLYNRAFAWVERRGGRVVGLWPLIPTFTYAQRIGGQLLYHTTLDFRDNEPRVFFPEELLCLEGLTIDNDYAADAIYYARQAFGLALARSMYTSTFFRTGGRFGGVLEIPEDIDGSARESIKKLAREGFETLEGAFRIFPAADGVKFHAGQFAPREAQLTEGERSSVRDIARRFNIAPSKLGEDARTGFATKAEDNRDYLETTLNSHLCENENELGFKLLDREAWAQERLEFRHQVDQLLRLDPLAQAQQLSTLRRVELINANEARAKLGYPRRTDDGGEDYGNPNTKPAAAAKPAPEDSGDEQKAATLRKLYGLLESTASRVARVACDRVDRERANGSQTDGSTEAIANTVLAACVPIVDVAATLDSGRQLRAAAFPAGVRQAVATMAADTTPAAERQAKLMQSIRSLF